MSRFNLIDEPWIPVRYPNGDRAELGIRDTLLGAKGITAIEDPSPLVVAALHRFLLAVLYRALEGPTDIDEARALFKAGIPGEKVVAYLEHWKQRFWLFDEQHPFFQTPTYTPKKEWRSWTVLAAEHNADNAKVLFDHIDVNDAGAISAAAAARWLLAAQTFALGGGNSELGYTSSAPSASAVMVLPVGRNLEDTLLLCLTPQNREVMRNDVPVWECGPYTVERLQAGITREVAGNAQLYTWPSRTIRLLDAPRGGVSQLAFAAGVKFGKQPFVDPMLAYRIDKKKGRLPRQFSERGLWRDFDSLLPDDAHLAPGVIEHAAALTRTQRERFPKSVTALGQANNKAKIEYWRMERYALPEALASDRCIRVEIRQLLSDTEDTQKALWQACRTYARNVLSRGERVPDGKDISKFVEQMPAISWYWSALEAAFHDVLRNYTLERDPDDIRCLWLNSVRNALSDAWAQHAASVSTGDAWAIRALVRAEGAIGKQLKALDEEIQKYEAHRNPQEETA